MNENLNNKIECQCKCMLSSLLIIAFFFCQTLYAHSSISDQDQAVFQKLLDEVEAKIKLDPNGASLLLDSLKLNFDVKTPSINGQLDLLEGQILLKNNDDEGLTFIDKALATFKNIDDEEGIANVRIAQMDYFRSQAKYGDAIKAAYAAVEIQEKWSNQVELASTFSNMSDIFWYMERFDEGITFGKRAVDILSQLEPGKELAFAYQMVGDNYMAFLDYTSALEYVNTAIEILKELKGYPLELSSALNARANNNKFLERYDDAIADYTESYRISDSLGYQRGITVATANIGHLHLLKNEYKESIPYFSEVVDILLTSENNQQIPENVKHLAESYAGIGDFQTSYKYMHMLDSFRTAEYQQSLEDELNDLALKYETEKKEESINTLSQRVSSQRLSLILGGGLLLFAVGGLFTFRRLNGKLKIKNSENVVLLKEIHHRVKNNLQILSSLLSLQSDHLVDSNAIDAIKEGRNRVESMGMIHQRLYGDTGLSTVNMSDYGKELCRHLENSFSSDKKKITIDDEITYEGMDVDFAIPLGLIINELVTNSIKYAFNDQSEGVLNVKLFEKDNKLILQVADNGSGSSNQTNSKMSTSFGSKLITALNKKLKGTMEIDQSDGYKCTIVFARYRNINHE